MYHVKQECSPDPVVSLAPALELIEQSIKDDRKTIGSDIHGPVLVNFEVEFT